MSVVIVIFFLIMTIVMMMLTLKYMMTIMYLLYSLGDIQQKRKKEKKWNIFHRSGKDQPTVRRRGCEAADHCTGEKKASLASDAKIILFKQRIDVKLSVWGAIGLGGLGRGEARCERGRRSCCCCCGCRRW